MNHEMKLKMVNGVPKVFDSDGCCVPGARSVLSFGKFAHVTIVVAVDGEIESGSYDLTTRPIRMEPA